MHITPAMALSIKGFETGAKMVGNRAVLLPHGQPALKAYLCPAKRWTIGWGSTGRGVTMNTRISLETAETMFLTDIAFFERGVTKFVNGWSPTTQGQFDALVSFAFNCGLDDDADTKAEGLGDSTLLKYHRAGRYAEAAEEFPKWTSGGMAGLVARRAVEKAFYLR
jgi:lysozyme